MISIKNLFIKNQILQYGLNPHNYYNSKKSKLKENIDKAIKNLKKQK